MNLTRICKDAMPFDVPMHVASRAQGSHRALIMHSGQPALCLWCDPPSSYKPLTSVRHAALIKH